MKPLNPALYLKRNFKASLPVLISMTTGVFLIYFFSLFSATTVKMVNVTSLDITEVYNVAYTKDGSPLPDSFLEEISGDGDVLPVQMNLAGLAYYRGGMGSTTMLTFNLLAEDTEALLDSFNISLVEGTLPLDNQNEILVPVDYALYNNLSVGDFIGTDISEEYTLQGSYRICGLTQGDVYFSVACQPGAETRDEIMSSGVLYRIDHLSAEQQAQLIVALPDNVTALTYDSYEQEYSMTLGSLQALVYIITAVIVLVLCIALGNLNVIQYADRRDELTILHSIGHTKGCLAKKLWTENLLVCFCGYLVGILFTLVAVGIANQAVMQPQGIALELLNMQGLVSALILPVFVSVFSLLPCLTSGLKT